VNSVDQQRKHFESISDKYFDARQHPNHLLYKKLVWELFFKRNSYVLHDGAKVIEPMCGYSEGKAILEDHCGKDFEYTGFDFSRPLVDRAKEKFPTANIYVQDVTKFAGQGQFDLMILIGGLHHVYAHVSSVLRKLATVLKPGGYLINLEPTQNNPAYRLLRQRIYRNNDLFDDETEQAFDLPELNNLYRDAGLVIQDQMFPGLLAYIMYYNPDAFPALNIGSSKTVRFLFALERAFYRSWLARKMSFATLSLLQKK
jgi:SAM-dependent methyltransferase